MTRCVLNRTRVFLILPLVDDFLQLRENFFSDGDIAFDRDFNTIGTAHRGDIRKNIRKLRGTASPRQITSRAIKPRLPHSPVLCFPRMPARAKFKPAPRSNRNNVGR